MMVKQQKSFWWKRGRGPEPRDTVSIRAKVDPTAIGIINALVDAHDGIACLRTTDPRTGDLEFWVSPDCLEDFWEMIAGIREVIDVRIKESKLPEEQTSSKTD